MRTRSRIRVAAAPAPDCHRALRWALAAAVLLALAAQTAQAVPRVQRYIEVTVTPDELDFGDARGTGSQVAPEPLKVRIAANCVHGGVIAEATALAGPGDAEIPTSRLFLQHPGTGQYLPMIAPMNLTGPMGPGVFTLDINLRLDVLISDPPGQYSGTVTFTIVAPN